MNHRGGEAGRQRKEIRQDSGLSKNQEKVRRESEFLVYNKGKENERQRENEEV